MEQFPPSERQDQGEQKQSRGGGAVPMPRHTIENGRERTDRFPPERPTPNTTGAPPFLGQSGGSDSAAITPENTGWPPNARQQPQEQPRVVGEKSEQAGRQAKQQAKQTRQQAKRKSMETASEAAQLAENKKNELQDASLDVAENGRQQLSQRLRKYEDLCENACVALSANNEPQLARASAYLNGQFRRVSDYVQARDARQIGNDAVTFAQRNPQLVIGTALAAGFLAGRAALASSRRGPEDGGET